MGDFFLEGVDVVVATGHRCQILWKVRGDGGEKDLHRNDVVGIVKDGLHLVGLHDPRGEGRRGVVEDSEDTGGQLLNRGKSVSSALTPSPKTPGSTPTS